ncbi:MAG: IS4 family transposase [Blastocatellia bacterium]
MQHTAPRATLQQIAPSYAFHPFSDLLRVDLEEALREAGKDSFRQGTILIPLFLVWIILGLTLRRDLNTSGVIEWMISAERWLDLNLVSGLISDGALSRARVALGFEVFQNLFRKSAARISPDPDFHGLVTAIFDGTTMTMPDTEENRESFGKPSCQYGSAGFPQLRLMTLLVGATHQVLEMAWAPYRGKGTGERSLMKEILKRLPRRGLLFLLDAGLYSFELLWLLTGEGEHFILKAASNLKLIPIREKSARLSDGSYLVILRETVDGQSREMVVRVVDCQVRGFRPFRLITSLLDEKISALEIARHYHQRWQIEISFDEIKTHQCATLRGQSPTILRSRRPDLIKQELFALLISYNAIRTLMRQAAERHGKAPASLRFLDSLQAIINVVPNFNWPGHPHSVAERRDYLLDVLSDFELKRPREGRINPRVVKVKSSKWERKTERHPGEKRDFEKDLSIRPPIPDEEGILMSIIKLPLHIHSPGPDITLSQATES